MTEQPVDLMAALRASVEHVAEQRRAREADAVTVCAACGTEACWQGQMYCEDYQTADTKTRGSAE